MADIYKANQVGAQGPNAQSHHNIFNQTIDPSIDKIDLTRLANELSMLRISLKEEAKNSDHDIAVGEIARAESCAKKGDKQEVLNHLKKAGQWALDIASKIGVPVAITALTAALGIK
jgi:hypothetical protein